MRWSRAAVQPALPSESGPGTTRRPRVLGQHFDGDQPMHQDVLAPGRRCSCRRCPDGRAACTCRARSRGAGLRAASWPARTSARAARQGSLPGIAASSSSARVARRFHWLVASANRSGGSSLLRSSRARNLSSESLLIPAARRGRHRAAEGEFQSDRGYSAHGDAQSDLSVAGPRNPRNNAPAADSTPRASPHKPHDALHATSSLVLYTRRGCHLCDQAADVLRRHGLAFTVVDVDQNDELKSRYDQCVPVVVIDGKERFRGRIDELLLRRLQAARLATAT